jgi:hypothetical protein
VCLPHRILDGVGPELVLYRRIQVHAKHTGQPHRIQKHISQFIAHRPCGLRVGGYLSRLFGGQPSGAMGRIGVLAMRRLPPSSLTVR